MAYEKYCFLLPEEYANASGAPLLCAGLIGYRSYSMKDMGDWKSVIAWGDFEELLNEEEKNNALKILLERHLPFISSITTHLGDTWPFSPATTAELSKIPGIVFRICIHTKTGKLEATSESPLLMFN